MPFKDIPLAQNKGIWRKRVKAAEALLDLELGREMQPSTREEREHEQAAEQELTRRRAVEDLASHRQNELDRTHEAELLHNAQQEALRLAEEARQRQQLINDKVYSPENQLLMEKEHQKNDPRSFGMLMEELHRKAERDLQKDEEMKRTWDKKISQAYEKDGENGVKRVQKQYEEELTKTHTPERTQEALKFKRERNHNHSPGRSMDFGR